MDPSLIKKTEFVLFDMKYENVSEGYIQQTNRSEFGQPFATVVSGQLTLLTHIPPPTLGGDEITSTNCYYYSDKGASNWKPYKFQVDRTDKGGLPATWRWTDGHGVQVARTEKEGLPTKLELKLSLPGNGTVYLRPIKLIGVAGSWWSVEQSGMVSGAVGVFGGVIGCFGGLLGCLAGFGKVRKFVLTTTKIFIVLGMLLTITGMVAILSGEPYLVWYVFLLPGIILTLVFSLNFPLIQRRYDDLEIRRMASMDAMRG